MAVLMAANGDLWVRLSRREKLGAVHGDVCAPRDAVENLYVSHHPFSELRGHARSWNRISRGYRAGNLRYRGGKDFAALYRGKPAVIVRLYDASFRRLLISADDADTVAAVL